LLSLSLADPPFAVNRVEIVCWYGVLRISVAGSQMWLTPPGLSNSTLVVTSKVRHPPAEGLFARTGTALVIAQPAQMALCARKKFRRFMTRLEDPR
jgi:hypothetical protein